jgi:hypothetical protein
VIPPTFQMASIRWPLKDIGVARLTEMITHQTKSRISTLSFPYLFVHDSHWALIVALASLQDATRLSDGSRVYAALQPLAIPCNPSGVRGRSPFSCVPFEVTLGWPSREAMKRSRSNPKYSDEQPFQREKFEGTYPLP